MNNYDLYKEYEGKEIDKRYLDIAFANIMEKENNLDRYINDFGESSDIGDNFGVYDFEKRTIKINTDLINKFCSKSNIRGMEVIKHEIEHAKNLKKLEQRKKDIESLIVLYSLKNYAIRHNLVYAPNISDLDMLMLIASIKANYNIKPIERLAEINAWKYIVNLLKNQRKTEDLLYAKTNLYNSLIKGYKDNRYYVDCPTYSFLLETRQFNDLKYLKNRVASNWYNLDTRLSYGLPITYQEFGDDGILRNLGLKKVYKEKAPELF